MIDWWGDTIQEYYAATEGGGTVITAKEWMERPGSVGLPWPGVEIRIYDDEGNQLGAGQIGTVYMQLVGRLRVQGRQGQDQGQPHRRASSPSATSASSTTTATCSCGTARAT